MGTKLNKNYMVVVPSGVLSEILIFDKQKECIITLEYGRFKDITSDCLKLTKRKQSVLGGLWYQFLHNEIDSTSSYIWDREIMLNTDNENEVDTFLLDVRIKQLKFMLEDAIMQEQKYNNNKQAYTYKFCERDV